MKTLMIAHRGAMDIAPENTLEAFELALQKGFKAVECDVQLTADGHLVIFHDETLNRLTGASGWLSRKSLKELRTLRVQKVGQIPTLPEVIDKVVIKHRCKLIIEIKGDSEKHAEKVAVSLARYLHTQPSQIYRHVEVHSFWFTALALFKGHMPLIKTAIIFSGGFTPDETIALAKKYNADGVGINYEFLSRKTVRACHKAKLFVDTWAISDGTVMKRLRSFGLEGITENFTAATAWL